MKQYDYDGRYEIRLGRREDIPRIMGFIDECWRKGHVMSQSRELFEYEFLDIDGETVNVVMAIERATGQLEGMFGFLRCSSSEDPDRKDIWGSIWKVRDDHENMPSLGLELVRRVYSLTGCRYQLGNGSNPRTSVVLRKLFLQEKIAKLDHYYLLNPGVEDYRIALIGKKWEPRPRRDAPVTRMRGYGSMEEVLQHFDVGSVDAVPYKDNWYFEKRYFRHPWYRYQVYGLQAEGGGGQDGALMVAREVACNGSAVLRIVDYIGEHGLFAGLGGEFLSLLEQKGYEYIDFYTHGFAEQAALDAGFRKREDGDGNIIPNYFEPFLRENVDIWAHYQAEGTLFFKADADQDRPNLAP